MNKRGLSLVLISLIAIVILVGTIVIIKSASVTGNAIGSRSVFSKQTLPGRSPSPILTTHTHVTDPFAVITSVPKTGGGQISQSQSAPSYWSSAVDCTRESKIQKLSFPQGTKFIVLEAGYFLESVSQTDFSGVVVYQDHTFPSLPTYPYSDVYYFKASDPQNKLKSATVYVTCAAVEPTNHLFSNKDY